MPIVPFLAAATLAAVSRQPAPHPCLDARDAARPVAAAPGQPSAVAVVVTDADRAAGRNRAWVGDTARGRCLGYVETAAGSSRWVGFAPRPAFTKVTFPGASDGTAATRDAAVVALLAGPATDTAGRGAPQGGASVGSDAPVAVTVPIDPPSRTALPNDPIARRYLSDFRRQADRLWTVEGSKWQGNYYDRAHVYYQAWRLFGDPEYRRRADAIAVDYRTNYLERNNYGTSPHWSQLEGLAEHYQLTKDEASRVAVQRTAARLSLAFMRTQYMRPAGGESRIAARVLHAQLLAWQLADKAAKPMWAARIDSALTLIAEWQQPDGSFPAINEVCGGQLNYMVGLLNDALAKTYDQYRADPKILAIVRRSADYLWTTQWIPEKRAFRYASVDCSRNGKGFGVGNQRPAPDLNNLIVTGFGWLYRKTGEARYRAAAEQIFAGGVEQAYLDGTKQFNENYTSGLRYLGFR